MSWFVLAAIAAAGTGGQPLQSASAPSTEAEDWTTNGAAVYYKAPGSGSSNRFDHFQPDSLHHLVWTNVMALTNGKSTLIWSVRDRPPGWPQTPPIVQWNTNCILWGMKGLTGLSPCWEDEGSPGQAPVTALTRRLGYTRGHSMGADGITSSRSGKKVWFLTTNNVVVEAVIQRALIRLSGGRDYTLLLFKADLPASIEPLRVESGTNLLYKYRPFHGAPHLFFKTEQGGHVALDLPGFALNTWKAGDSGSPDLLPMPGELVFTGGRSTSSATPLMQTDINVFCRIEGLDPEHQQLHWFDFSTFRSY